MSFIEEIQPYIERIKLHQKGGRITNIEVLREIRDIHFKYIRSKDFDTPSNLGCNNCVRQMINQLMGEIGRQEDRAKSVKGKKMSFPKQEPIGEIVDVTESDRGIDIKIKPTKDFTISLLKWGAFKKYCTSKGIKVKGKKRTDLENELKGLKL